MRNEPTTTRSTPGPRALARAATIALALSGALAPAPAQAAPESPGAWQWTPEAVVDTVSVGGVTISPDGSAVVFTRSRWRTSEAKPGPAWGNLWRVPFAGGDPQRLTSADADDSRPRWSPDGSRIAFLSKRGGGDSPKTRVWILPVRAGEPWPLTGEKIDVISFEWSPDGKSIAYLAADPKSDEKEKEEKAGKDPLVIDADLKPRRLWIVAAAEDAKPEPLRALGEMSAWDFAWAPDGTSIAATVTNSNRTDDSYLMKRILVLPLSGSARELVPVVGKISEIAWSKDSRSIAWLGGADGSDPSTGNLFVIAAAGGTPKNLTGSREETAQSLFWRPDGRIHVTVGTGTRSAVQAVSPATGAWETIVSPGVSAFTSTTWSDDGVHYAFAGATATQPTDVWAGSLAPPSATPGGKRARRDLPPGPDPPRRIVSSNLQLDGLPRGAQETVRYKAKDGLEIEGLLIRPIGFAEGKKYPLVVIAHGGPESHYLDGWQNSYGSPGHALAERGYMVFFPNYRGSTGRGVAYAKADHKDLGGKEFTDVLDGIDWLTSKGWIDPKRVGITGGSYGGYFTALGVTRYSDRFAAGVEMFGITSWESFLGQSDIPVENAMVHWALWCYENAELCRERSAIGNLDRAATPTLILQGKDDERVPKPQSDELYAALRWKKVPVEYVVYPREPHGFRERWHRLDALTRMLGWFDKYLKPGS